MENHLKFAFCYLPLDLLACVYYGIGGEHNKRTPQGRRPPPPPPGRSQLRSLSAHGPSVGERPARAGW